jgi:hypothetical protein
MPSTPAESSNSSAWKRLKPWVRPLASLLIIGLIFGWMIHKIAIHWADVKDRAGSISIVNFAIASVLFAVFLFVFRSLVWRQILKGFGHVIPLAPATRIWSTSEMARYIPGVIWQVAGRVYLVKPYGVTGPECAASQVLELVIFLLANILLGVTCLVIFGFKNIHGSARLWMFILAAMVPLLALMLHPRVFYGSMNKLMARLKKPALTNQLSGAEMGRLLGWNILGLLLQSVAVFLIVAPPLGLHWGKWYVVTGAYCLAWCAGFLAVLNPGGLGVREAVFVAAMQFALPDYVRVQFSNKAVLVSFLTFLSGLLRLWTIAGELILTGLAHAFDHRGALGRSPTTPSIENKTEIINPFSGGPEGRAFSRP